MAGEIATQATSLEGGGWSFEKQAVVPDSDIRDRRQIEHSVQRFREKGFPKQCDEVSRSEF